MRPLGAKEDCVQITGHKPTLIGTIIAQNILRFSDE